MYDVVGSFHATPAVKVLTDKYRCMAQSGLTDKVRSIADNSPEETKTDAAHKLAALWALERFEEVIALADRCADQTDEPEWRDTLRKWRDRAAKALSSNL